MSEAAHDATWGMVVIHYRDPYAVTRLLEDATGWTAPPAHVVVVDNSGDLPADHYPTATVVPAGGNLGYAGAVNVGFARLREMTDDLEHVLVCTQDAALEQHTAATLLATARTGSRIGAVGPLLTFSSDPTVLFSSGGALSRRGIGTHPGQGEPKPDLHGAVDTDWMDGAVLLLSADALLEVDGLDERYFLYYEEIDLQVRLRDAGWRVVIDRDAVARQEPGNYRTYFKYRNGVYFSWKFSSSFRRWPWVAQFARDSLRAAAGRAAFQPVWAVRGVLDGKRRRMGPPPTGVLRPASSSTATTPDDPAVVVVTEFPPDDLPTGVRRRYEHVMDHLLSANIVTNTAVLGRTPRRATSVPARIRAARRAAHTLADLSSTAPTVVIGLGTPTMLIAARTLARSGRPVVFDHCDSLLIQVRERLRSRDLRLIAIVLWLLALHVVTSRRIALSYISQRDAVADRAIDLGRRIATAPPTTPAALSALPPVRTPLNRVVVPIELASRHAREGWSLLLEVLGERATPIAIDLYGPTSPDGELPAGVQYRGFAPELADLYRGDTAVLVTNIGGSGVPNKLVEAATANRPLVLHPSLLDRWPLNVPVHLFRTADDLGRALAALAANDLGEMPDPRAMLNSRRIPLLADMLRPLVRRRRTEPLHGRR